MFDSPTRCIWVTWELDRYTILRPRCMFMTQETWVGPQVAFQVILMLAVIWKPLTDPIHLTITSYSGNSVYWPKKKKGNKTLLFWSYFPFNQPYDITPYCHQTSWKSCLYSLLILTQFPLLNTCAWTSTAPQPSNLVKLLLELYTW